MSKTFMGKRVLKWQQQTVDTTTGEVLVQEKRFLVETKGLDFYFVFNEALGFITQIKSHTELWVLSKLCNEAEFNTGICYLTTGRRLKFSSEIGINVKYFNICLRRLEKKNVIKNSGGNIEINPICFWKGETAERDKKMADMPRELRIIFDVKK